MSYLSRLTADLKREGRKPLVPFLTAGYPDPDTFARVMGAVAEAGCPVVEIGIPFSDPVADGPVIQAASQRALAQGMTLAKTLQAAKAAREAGLTVVLMGYLNPLLKMGLDVFPVSAREHGVSGVIVPDLPLEESGPLRASLAGEGIDLIDLVAPTTGDDRLARYAKTGRGFLYLVSTTGVTGSGAGTDDRLEDYVARARAAVSLPLYVGFGIATPEQASRVADCADGAVVGSALIRVLDEAGPGAAAAEAARTYLTELNTAMNRDSRDS